MCESLNWNRHGKRGRVLHCRHRYLLAEESKKVLPSARCNTKWIRTFTCESMAAYHAPFFGSRWNAERCPSKIFLTGYEKSSPTYMTMYWLHHALQRSEALQKVQRIVVVSNNWDDPFAQQEQESPGV